MVLGFSNLRSQDLPDLGRRAQVIPAGATMAESGWSVGPLPVHWPQTAFWEARGTAFVVACQPFAPSTLTHSAGQGVDGCLASQASEPLTHSGRRSLRVILRSIRVARLCAFASFTEPFRWPSASWRGQRQAVPGTRWLRQVCPARPSGDRKSTRLN